MTEADRAIGSLVLRPDHPALHPASRTGMGHVARCLALGSAWARRGGSARLLARRLDDGWSSRCSAADVVVADPSDSDPLDVEWVVLDGYRWTGDDQRRVRNGGHRVLVIDDHGTLEAHDADLILDQNLGAVATDYEDASARTPPAVLLLGLRYLLLHDEFRHVDARAIDLTRPASVLIAAGGQPSDEVAILVAAVSTSLRDRGLAVAQLEGATDVVGAMSTADIIVTPAGTTAYEACRVGVPAVLLAVADNQQPLGERLAAKGASVYLGPIERLSAADIVDEVMVLAVDPDRRAAISAAARNLADDQGADRVVDRMLAFRRQPLPSGGHVA